MTTSALDIAAPTAAIDPLAPWIGARTPSERALAATFLVSIGGLSSMFHVTAVVFALIGTLLPIPFLADACSSVKRVTMTPPERVVMSIVEVKPPPEVVEEVPPPPPPTEERRPVAKVGKAKKARLESEVMATGMLALLGSSEPAGGVFGALDSADHADVFGALVGGEIGDAFVEGGLGLRGVGVAGGVADVGTGGDLGSIGIGGLGTIGRGGGGTGMGAGYGSGLGGLGGPASVRVDVVETDLAREGARRALLATRSALAACADELPADLTVRVVNGKVVSTDGAPPCVARALTKLVIAGTGYAAIHVAAR